MRDLVESVKASLEACQDEWDRERIPLDVTVSLRSPLCLNHPWVNGDWLLAYLVMRDALGEAFWRLPWMTPLPLRIPLPLAETHGVWHGSVGMPPGESLPSATTIFKRFGGADVSRARGGKARYVSLSSGRFRNWMIRLPLFPPGDVVFSYCGDFQTIERLFGHLRFLGKKASIGFGAVGCVTVETREEDRSLVDPVSGTATRPIPIRCLERSEDAVTLAWCPPYWDRRMWELCAPPGAHVILLGG